MLCINKRLYRACRPHRSIGRDWTHRTHRAYRPGRLCKCNRPYGSYRPYGRPRAYRPGRDIGWDWASGPHRPHRPHRS